MFICIPVKGKTSSTVHRVLMHCLLNLVFQNHLDEQPFPTSMSMRLFYTLVVPLDYFVTICTLFRGTQSPKWFFKIYVSIKVHSMLQSSVGFDKSMECVATTTVPHATLRKPSVPPTCLLPSPPTPTNTDLCTVSVCILHFPGVI